MGGNDVPMLGGAIHSYGDPGQANTVEMSIQLALGGDVRSCCEVPVRVLSVNTKLNKGTLLLIIRTMSTATTAHSTRKPV